MIAKNCLEYISLWWNWFVQPKNVNKSFKILHFIKVLCSICWPCKTPQYWWQKWHEQILIFRPKWQKLPLNYSYVLSAISSCVFPNWGYLKVDETILVWPEAGRLLDQSSHQMAVEGEGTNEELKGELTLPQSLLLANLQSLIIARVKLLPLPYNSSHLPM